MESDWELFDFSDKQALDDFVIGTGGPAGAEFLQSWQWGEILRADGAIIRRLGVRSLTDGRILAAATLIRQALGGSYCYWSAPRGPVLVDGLAADDMNQISDFLFAAIRQLDAKALFLRMEPRRAVSPFGRIIKKSLDLQPRQTLLLDLSASSDGLLAAMHEKTRYNLRLAEKKGVRVRLGGAADRDEFSRLMQLTGARDGFRLHEAGHYRNLLTAGGGLVKMFLAEYQGRHIAAGLFSFWGDKATYLHGASDNEFRNVMAPYLLQWTAIGAARDAGLRYYDFHGIDEKKWPGVTRFKLGFGGRRVEYAGTWDLVFRPAAYRAYVWLRKIKRAVSQSAYLSGHDGD